MGITAIRQQILRGTSNPFPALDEGLKILTRLHKKASKPRITIASAKAKGRSLPTKARQDLIEALDIDPGDIKVTPGGCAGIDLYLSPEARKKFPYGTECKNVEKLNFWSSWDQAATNAEKEGLEPLLLMHKNGSETLCALRWKTYLHKLELLANEAPSRGPKR